ncbi:MAG TPA: hypothetical protein ENK63_01010 [Rhodobacterales bacterium]|nr:hypothetical protein [Rhodobacterales bacterium]
MITPILRLVLIYFALIAALVAVFNRDRLTGLFGGGEAAVTATEASAPQPKAYTPVAPPVNPGPEAPVAPAADMPVYGSDLQAPLAGDTPQSQPQQQPQAQPQPQPQPQTSAPSEGANAQAAIAAALNAARGAYWRGDVEGAKAQMLALTRAHPQNVDLQGELGNLYFYLRDFPAAAEAWHRAGVLLIEQGGAPQSRGFMQALGMIDPEKAADLAARAQGR